MSRPEFMILLGLRVGPRVSWAHILLVYLNRNSGNLKCWKRKSKWPKWSVNRNQLGSLKLRSLGQGRVQPGCLQCGWQCVYSRLPSLKWMPRQSKLQPGRKENPTLSGLILQGV